MVRKLLMFVTVFLLTITVSFAQTGSISGNIVDGDGLALIGANVVVKGTTIGTITDIDGNYTLNGAPVGEQIIVASFIGFDPKEFPLTIIENQTITLNVTLTMDATELEELVVIGYGVQKKEDKTGAVYNISEEDIQTVAVQDPIEGIQGKIAGVTIRKGGSDPNSGFDVKIRGASGLSSGTNPLYVVDGVVGVDPTTIAPEDIASFNVLKDASSAAIYGSRGANGVILIKTKQGKAGDTKVELGAYATVDQIAKRSRLDLMSADEYRAFGDQLGISYRDEGFNTDWQDEIYRTGLSHNETISFSGGTDKGNYRASVSNNEMQGIINNSGKERMILRMNAQSKLFDDRLDLSMNLSNTIEHNDYVNYGSSGADGTLYQAFQRNPTIPVYNADGSFYQDPTPPVNNYSNPVAILNDIQNERDAKRLLANVRADITIVEGLKLSINSAYTRDDDETFYFEPASNGPLNGEGKGSRSYSNNSAKLIEVFASYNKEWGAHTLNAVGGYSHQTFNWDGFSAYGENPGSDYTQSNDLRSMGKVVPGNIDSYKGESYLISGFGRAAYNFDRKYFITATLRRDGSSKFGANNEWGLFPSGSVAWNMKRESFLESVDAVSQAKLRLGYGQTGNQEIDSYRNIALFGVTGYTLDPVTGRYTVNYGAIQNPNPDLKWEVNTEINVGIDFGFLQDRITGSFDYYNKKTTDLIYSYSVPVPPNLVNTTLANAGAIDINGLEVVLTGHIVNNSRFKWSTTVVASHDKAIVASLGNEDFPPVDKVLEGYLQEPLGFGTATQILQEGEERGTFFGPKFAGIDQNTGAFLYETAAGTYNTIDNITDDDKQILGTAQPELELGWSNTMKIGKGWDVSFTFRGMFGHDVLNATNMVFDNPSYFPTRNVLNSATGRTILTGPSDFSDYWLEKGNFFRLENINVGYTFDTKNVTWLSKARLFATANNLWTITNYSGIDPSTIGIDIFNIYPKSTSVTLGFNVVF